MSADRVDGGHCRHAPAAAPNSADDEIVAVIRADEHPDDLVVVTSDRALIERARSAGATVVSPGRLRAQLDVR